MRGSTSSTGSKASTIVNACIRRSAIKHPSMQNSVVAMWRDLVHVQSRQGHIAYVSGSGTAGAATGVAVKEKLSQPRPVWSVMSWILIEVTLEKALKSTRFGL